MSEVRDISAQIKAVAESVERRFQRGRRVLAFAEYLELFGSDPVRYARDASRYLRDCFDQYGTSQVLHPWGEFTRWKLFDLPWEEAPPRRPGAPETAFHAATAALP